MALTVLGRPPGLAQIPLSEAESEMLGVSISSPNSPAAERPYSPQDRFSAHPPWVLKTAVTSVALLLVLASAVFVTRIWITYTVYGVCLNASHCTAPLYVFQLHFLYFFSPTG